MSRTVHSLSKRLRRHWRVSIVYWLSIAGIGLWTACAASGRIPGTPAIQIKPFLFILLAATVNLGIRSYERVRRELNPHPVRSLILGWVFVTVDMMLVTLGLRFTGGLASPLWVVMFLIGVAETLLTTTWEANLIRGAGVLALILGTLPSTPPADSNFWSYYWLEIALRSGLFFAVASVTRRLREQNDEKERENASLRAELSLAEERSKLSREVHDGVGNSLAATVLRLEVAARTAEKARKDEESAAMFRDEANALREAMTAVRDWTFFTRPWSVGDEKRHLAPSASLTTEVDRLARRTGLPMHVEGAEELDHLSPVARLTALRIVQEALTNAAKHASGATRAEVSLKRDGTTFLLSIADDGAGFDPTGEHIGAGIGMSSMRERAEGVGGSLTVDSSPGLGTTLTARLPAA
jgi:signal transduction histidine kinase